MTGELAQRIALTLGALLLFSVGQLIPLPGVNPDAWAMLIRSDGGGVAAALGLSVGSVRRVSIFALGIVPYVTAAVLMQIGTMVSGTLRTRARAGERGRAAMVRYARYLTLVLTAFQAWGVASGLEHVRGVAAYPGVWFIVSTVITLSGGTMFLVWLAEQITARGIGNGIALILLTGIVTEIPAGIAYALELIRRYGTSNGQIAAVVLVAIVVTAAVVAVELARRRLPVRYAARAVGTRRLDEGKSELSLKLNPGGIVPVLLASFVMGILAAVVGFFAGFDSALVEQLRPATPVYLIVYAILIIFCTYFYTASVIDPEEAAEELARLGGKLDTIEPGEATAAYLDRTLSRTTLIGAIYLALVCLLPDLLIRFAQVPLYFGGTALLITVCTMLDLQAQYRAERRTNSTSP
jgi:preprotein translocase subunit SecY